MKYTLLAILAFIFIGCSSKEAKPLYNWGDYQSAQLAYSKSTDDPASLKKYKATLEKLVNQNRVPPSIYSEYAIVLTKLGQKDEARQYFLKEIQTYPESKVFIENVMKKIYGE